LKASRPHKKEGKRLTLIRHAKSDWSSAVRPDFDRPLNPRGKNAAPMMGRRMAERGIIPEQLISSPAVRARQTSCLLARELGFPEKDILYQEEIYAAGLETLIKLINSLEATLEHVALIGHNPGITQLARWLCDNSPDHLPTCAVLTLDLEAGNWLDVNSGCGHIHCYDYPKKSR
jgi:phosphohistidine phosphatase